MAKKVAVETIPEVERFMEAKNRLDSFRIAHPKFFEELDQLASDFNTTLEQADKAVRAQGVSCGPFDAYQEKIAYDAEKLYELVGREKFLQYGGKLETVTQYSVDKTTLKSLIASNKVPSDLADEISKKSVVYHAPKPLKVG